MHPEKELDFFSFDERYADGFDAYRARFADAGAARAVGEGSPTYTKLAKRPAAAGRVAEHLPHARLLYIVRHPLRRMESAWLHARRSNHRRAATFAETVREIPEYVDTSDYGRQLDAYRAHFPADRILVLFFEEFVADPRPSLRAAFEHLDVDPAVEIDLDRAPANPSLGRAADADWLRAVRRSRAFKALDRRAPGLARALTRPFRRTLTDRPSWDEETLAFVRARLEESTSRFLESQGRAADLWPWT